jgi:hypothetical protein
MRSAPNAKVNADSHRAATGGRVLAVAGILTLAALAAYWNSFKVPFVLNFAGSGLSVRGYHAVNLLIHVCAGLALRGIGRRPLPQPAPILWASHWRKFAEISG